MQLPRGEIGVARMAGRTGARDLPVLPDGKPVTEFTIFTAGVNDSDYGPIVYDEIAAAFLTQNQAIKGNRLQFDYNHGMARDPGDPPPTAEQGKSAGTFNLDAGVECRATDIMWTGEAYDRIERREYSLFSPWFQTIRTEDGIVRPFRLFNVAILNVAGLNDIDQIAAGAATNATKERPMLTQEQIEQLQARNRELESDNARLRAVEGEVSMISTTLALGPKVSGVERHAALTGLLQLRSEVRAVTGKDTDAGAVAELHSIKARAGQVETLQAAAEEAQQRALTERYENAFKMGAAAGHTICAPGPRKNWEDTVLAAMKRITGGKLTEDIIAAAEGTIAASAKVPTPGRSATPPAGGTLTPGGGRIVILGATQGQTVQAAAAAVTAATGGYTGPQVQVELNAQLSKIPGVKPEYLARAALRQQERRERQAAEQAGG